MKAGEEVLGRALKEATRTEMAIKPMADWKHSYTAPLSYEPWPFWRPIYSILGSQEEVRFM